MYFCRLSPDEFRHVCEAYGDSREALYQDGWARMRMLATITVQPHVRKRLTPEALLPLPWERKPKHEAVPLHEDKARLEMLMKKMKKG